MSFVKQALGFRLAPMLEKTKVRKEGYLSEKVTQRRLIFRDHLHLGDDFAYPAAKHSLMGDKFNWEQQWYPLAVEECTDRTRPLHMQLLGKDLVLWFDGKDWRAFDDVCPHRGVRLSEGRIEKEGELLCSYHAWRLDKEGKCSHIPQAENAVEEAKQKANPNHCAKVYPVRVEQGLIWVWGESGAPGSDVSLQAALKNPQLIEELHDESLKDRIIVNGWNSRYLPYGWDVLFENFVDPAHVPVSHHGIAGSRYNDATFLSVRTVPSLTKIPKEKGGLYDQNFSADIGFKNIITANNVVGNVSHEFRPPCLIKLEFFREKGTKFILPLYGVPVAPGKSLFIGYSIVVKNEQLESPKPYAGFEGGKPKWMTHIFAPLFLHQDQGFLHYQQINMFAQTGYAFGRFPPGINTTASVSAFYDLVNMPNRHDKGIAMLRNWISKAGQGGPRWGGEGGSQRWMQGKGMSALQTLAEPLPNSELFNTFEQHTKHCTICKQTLRNFKIAKYIIYLSLAGVVGYSLWIRDIQPWQAFIAVALTGSATAVENMIRLYYMYDFHHQENN